MPRGLPGRLSKGAGTHLASWLQEVQALSAEEGQALLDAREDGEAGSGASSENVRGVRAKEGLFARHGARAGHAHKITDVCWSGEMVLTKDKLSLRLWRARGDFALLRVVSARGAHVAVHPCGQFIVTGTRSAGATSERSKAGGLKIWGPAGGSAFSAGKKDLTTGNRVRRGGEFQVAPEKRI
jgi:hypothetical protein